MTMVQARSAETRLWKELMARYHYLGHIASRSPTPWSPSKATPSFLDALAALRRAIWRDRIFLGSTPRPLSPKVSEALIDILARAA